MRGLCERKCNEVFECVGMEYEERKRTMIFFDKDTNTFFLESKEITYAFCTTKFGFLNHIYYGKRIAREDLTHSVYHIDRDRE